ncbi:MAG: TIM barrel protein [Planctomycetota bacterium]
MNRRQFLMSGAAGAALAGAGRGSAAPTSGPRRDPFRLRYAPHFGMFRHHAESLEGQVAFMAEQGFTALEDNGMGGRPVAKQEEIRAAMEKHGLAMGVFVASADFREVTFAAPPDRVRERIEADLRKAVEVAKRVGAQWATVVPGCYDPGTEWDYQTANAIENLKRAAAICEESGLVMVLEPLNPWRDHPRLFLTKMPQAYLICRAVGSPSCKILCDIYHQQITEGNLIPNIDRCWDEIAYFQTGDNPGRKEPTTGEINYRNLFGHIHAKGFEGIIGMEHGNSKGGKAGELAVVEAYRSCDAF